MFEDRILNMIQDAILNSATDDLCIIGQVVQNKLSKILKVCFVLYFLYQ